MSELFRVAITGSIGSGKSTIAKMLAEYSGASLVCGDDLIKKIVKSGRPAHNRIVSAFSIKSIRKDGSLDTYYISKIIKDPIKRKLLNHILIHPLFMEVIQKFAELEQQGTRYVIYDAPLLYESGASKMVDYVAIVNTIDQIQLKQVMKKNRLSTEEAKSLIAQHSSYNELMEYDPDFILRNEGGFNKIKDRISVLWRAIKKQNGDYCVSIKNK